MPVSAKGAAHSSLGQRPRIREVKKARALKARFISYTNRPGLKRAFSAGGYFIS